MTLAVFNALDNSLQWLGVGNVEGLLVRSETDGKRAREPLLLSRGILGAHLPPLHTSVVKISPGDTLVLATDGIRRGFGEEMALFEEPEITAQGIPASYGLESDDALVLVATYQGRRS